ncbi:P-loop containing nucleoside triphosphate hydrolase protein [Favolaschia claudopus]|uniref:P-loop containing nucleoside triphosphate hydrolase protein n=1 Tax=Favolaschia claudopus TaxID=2862362 RepID=A0AAV9ZJM3_9AGAR
MGFRPGFHLEKQDCERRNVALIVRVIKHTSSGLIFLDLDFLVPPGIFKASDAPKYLVFVQTIDQGHRLVNYLRSLLPLHLQKDARKLIRHHHSMACPECKAEGMESLYKCGEDRDCLVHVSTDVLTVGVDIPGLAGVVIFDKMSSAAAVLQRAGRPVRERGTNGVAYVYVSKANMAEAMTYLNSAAGKADKRVLHAKDPTSHIRDIIPSEETAAADSDSTPIPGSSNDLPGLAAAEHPATSSATKKKGNVTSVSSKPGHRTCTSLLLIFAAHARDRCIQRQINMIYDNPGVDADCGRCSSCVGDKIPRPRETAESTSASAVSTAAGEDGDPELGKLPGFMKPQTKDLKGIAEKLEMSARKFRWMEPMGVDALLVSSRIFLPPRVVSSITSSFLLITSKEILMERVCDWTYKDKYGDMLWEVVNPLVSELSHELVTRHNITLEKQRDARLHKWIVSAGLDHIQKVQLKLPPPPPPADSEDPVPQTPPPLTATVPPTIFYSPPS